MYVVKGVVSSFDCISEVMDVMVTGRGHGRAWGDCFAILITRIFIRDCYLQYTNFVNLTNKEWVILIIVISVHALGKQGAATLLTRLLSLIGHLLCVMKNGHACSNKNFVSKYNIRFLFSIWFWKKYFLIFIFHLVLEIYY